MKKMFKNFIFIFILSLIVIPSNCFAMQISINTLDGESIIIEAEDSDTIEAVKVKIYEGFKKEGNDDYLPELQKLTFNGKNLDDGRTLADYEIKKEQEKTIIVTLIKTHFNITYKLSNLTSTNIEMIEMGKDFEITLEADKDYELPNSINVSMNGETFDKYTYDKETGKVIILSDDITGDIEISATGIEVVKENNPKTGDNINLFILSGSLSLISFTVIMVYIKKCKRAY